MMALKYLNNDRGNKIANCVVIMNNNDEGNLIYYLFSYEYLIAEANYLGDDKWNVVRRTDFRSNTTSKHLKAFFEDLGINMTVKDFYSKTELTEK